MKKIDIPSTLFVMAAGAFMVIGLVVACYRDKEAVTPPVERNIAVDSLVKVNDSIKITINNLDSIKNAKVIEVQSLDNDSTLKLFYELIRE